MKVKIFAIMSIIAFLISLSSFKKRNEDEIEKLIVELVQKKNKQLLLAFDSLLHYTKTADFADTIEVKKAKKYFVSLRKAYKNIEWYTTYFTPTTASMLNSPLISSVDEFDPNQFSNEPEGLQQFEAVIWSDSLIQKKYFLIEEMKRSRGAVMRANQIANILEVSKFQIFDALRFEIIRIYALNLTGFDSPFALNSTEESIAALSGVEDVIKIFQQNSNKSKRLFNALNSQIKTANLFLANADFYSLNRAEFISKHANKIYESIVLLEQSLNIERLDLPTAIYFDALNIFNEKAWNKAFYTQTKKIEDSKEKIELGRMLFFDPLLSGNNKRACASCHRSDYAFAEPLAQSALFDLNGSLKRNAPSIINAAFQKGLFWDSRVFFLEDQIVEVNQNEEEMHGNFNESVKKLKNSEEYVELFKRAFSQSADSAITGNGIIMAIAAYERNLVSMNSPFDIYMRGNDAFLTKEEIEGFNIFMGKGQCGTCHFMPFFGGTVPPNFEETELEIIGTPQNKQNMKLDNDLGRFNVAKVDIQKYAFKTPALRNVALTPPYMHNGVYENLEQVMDFYNKGGGIGHGYEVPNQTLVAAELNLNKDEITSVISFLKTLSDTAGLTIKPTKLPQLQGAFSNLNNRRISGAY